MLDDLEVLQETIRVLNRMKIMRPSDGGLKYLRIIQKSTNEILESISNAVQLPEPKGNDRDMEPHKSVPSAAQPPKPKDSDRDKEPHKSVPNAAQPPKPKDNGREKEPHSGQNGSTDEEHGKTDEIIQQLALHGITDANLFICNGVCALWKERDTWFCAACELPNLSFDNILSHVRGKHHKNSMTAMSKIRSSSNAETSTIELLKAEHPDEISYTMSDNTPIFLPFDENYLFCKLCRAQISNIWHNLYVHAKGSKHMKAYNNMFDETS